MLRTRFTLAAAAIATAAAVLPAGASAAGSPADRAASEARTVCAAGTYVKERPDAIPVDHLKKGETIDVKRYSPSRQWAYGKPRGSKHAHLDGGWVKVADLCAKGSAAKSKRYSVRIAPGSANTGPVYVGGLSNITVKDAQRAGQRLQLCITPAPTERPSCRSGRTGRTIDTIAWSQAGPTKVRIAIEGGPVIVKTVNVRAAQQ